MVRCDYPECPHDAVSSFMVSGAPVDDGSVKKIPFRCCGVHELEQRRLDAERQDPRLVWEMI